METVSFTIKFGDTSDPHQLARQIAEELDLRSWTVKESDSPSEDEGIAATKYVIQGWSTEW